MQATQSVPGAVQPMGTAAPKVAPAPGAVAQTATAAAAVAQPNNTTTAKCSRCGETQQNLKANNLRLKPCPCRKV